MTSEKMTENRCVICLKEIEVIEKPDGTKIVCDNNAHPIMDGRCCDACDCLLVIPSRHIGTSLLTDIGSSMLSLRLLHRHAQKKGFGDSTEKTESKNNES